MNTFNFKKAGSALIVLALLFILLSFLQRPTIRYISDLKALAAQDARELQPEGRPEGVGYNEIEKQAMQKYQLRLDSAFTFLEIVRFYGTRFLYILALGIALYVGGTTERIRET